MIGLKINKDTLKIYSFTEEDIQKLIKDKIITQKNETEYELVDINKLYHYGITLLLKMQIKRADTCFYKCHKLDPEHREVCLQILLSDLKRKNYHKLVNDFIMIDKIKPTENRNNNNLYLYLLNIIVDLPKELENRIKNIDVNNISIKQDNSKIEHIIKYSIVTGKFPYALKLLNDLIKEKIIYVIEYEVLKELITQVTTKEKIFKTDLFFQTKRKEYDIVLSSLKQKSMKRNLKSDEICIAIAAKAIMNLIETREIPVPTVTDTNSLYEALNGNNFKLAKELNDSFLQSVDIAPEKNTLSILLLEINKLIEEITEEKLISNVLSNELITNQPLVRKKTLY